jgi:hypothetical protein
MMERHQDEVARRAIRSRFGDFAFAQVDLRAREDEFELSQLVKAAEGEIEQIMRDATRAAARNQGIELGAALELNGIDEKRQAVIAQRNAFGDGIGEYQLSADMGDGDPKEISAMPEQERCAQTIVVDWNQLREETERIGLLKSRRLGARLAKQALETGRDETFSTLALLVMRVTGYIAAGSAKGPRRHLSVVIGGAGQRNELIDFWSGRPHTHVFRFAAQSDSAAENERRFGDDFASILARMRLDRPIPPSLELPQSSNALDEVGSYIGIGGTLWVHGRKSLSSDLSNIGRENRGMHVHENQAKVELLEYGLALHRRIAHRALATHRSPSNALAPLLQAQQDLAEFELSLHDTGAFGEIRALLERGWEAFGLPQLRRRIGDVLRVRYELGALRRGSSVTRWTSVISLVAGVLTAPPLADVVVRPLWSLMGLHRPANDNAFSLLTAGVAFAGVSILLAIGYRWASAPQREKVGGGPPW